MTHVPHWVEVVRAHHFWMVAWERSAVVMELALTLFTVWWLPVRLPLRWWGTFFYTALVAVLWMTLTFEMLVLDYVTDVDAIAFGHLALGFFLGLMGLFVYFVRWVRQQRKKEGLEP